MAGKKELIRCFGMYGMTLRSDAAGYLCELLDPLPREEYNQWLDAVVETVQRQPITSGMVSKEDIHRAAQEVRDSKNENLDNILEVIDIFKIPKLTYDGDKKKFILAPPRPLDLHGKASDKAALFLNRYSMIYQRTAHHEVFKQPVLADANQSSKTYSLQKVVYLLGASCQQEKVLVMGLLTRLVEGKYHLEDDTGHIEVDLSNATFHTGLFTLNCFVLVEGRYEDNLLYAEAIGLPPPESASTTRERMLMKNENYFGGSRRKNAKGITRLHQLEKENSEAMFVVLSDVWLDKDQVMDKLRVLFAGYAHFPPTAFILCGNFFSERQSSQQLGEVRKAFGALGSLIAGFPELVAHSRFIFVPGPSDPGPSEIFPRPALFKCVTESLRQALPSACFATNPCRLLYCTQEMVVMREDIVAKMCRNCVHFPDSSDFAVHVAKTLVNQGHLAPLPLHTMPVYWPLDHCMMLHPTPDVIIIADKDNTFTTAHNGAIVFNPGSFLTTDFSFKVYFPSTRQVEDSQVTEEES